ncbi:DUF1648 domain-containing protein [Curtobacterium sp. MCBD17_023]|uniref:DUF1648 domain-containing protein n=1 Tax=Curtobacterium sp. MCBD17_023 TaxID=2175657 RepID=UPI000D90B598|nr:DUF1648 domain-containing protein [Curtobacterium sp. MCBD17_023]PYY47504.1 hypothetical protein DEI84_11145 [Curtobacterium sp. MCBD17_023]
MRDKNRWRPYWATSAAALPVIAEVAASASWWERLPDRIPVTFDADGSPSGYATPLSAVIALAVIQAPFLTAAVGSAFARNRRKGQVACSVTTGFVATLAASWLIMASLSALSLSSSVWWALLAGPAWAVVPYLLLRTRGVSG